MPQFDVNRVKSIASRYQGYGENSRGFVGVTPRRQAAPSTNFIGNVFNSIRNLGMEAGKGVFSMAKQSLWDEPGKLAQHFIQGGQKQFNIARDQLGAAQHARDIQRRLQQGQKVSRQEIDAVRQRTQRNMQAGTQNLWDQGSTFVVGSKNYREKFLPPALTVASIASLGTTAPLSAGIKGTSTAAKAARFGARFGDDLFGFGSKFGKSLPMNIAGKLARNQLLIKPTINDIGMLPGQIASGKYGDAAINAALLASGGLKSGPIGSLRNLATYGFKGADAAGVTGKTLGKWKGINSAFIGSAGVFDKVKIAGGKSVYSAFETLAKKSPKQAEKVRDTLRVFDDYLVRQWGSPKVAAKAFQEYIGDKNLSKMSLKTLTKELDNFRSSDVAIKNTAKKLAKKGLLVDEAGNKISVEQAAHIGAVRSPGGSTNDLLAGLSTSTNQQQAAEAVANFAKNNPQFVANRQNQRMLEGLVESGKYGDDAVKQARASFTKTKQVFADSKKGKRAIEATGGFVGGMRSGIGFRSADEVGDITHGKDGVLAGVGRLFEKAGISPSSSSEGQARFISEKVRKGMDDALDEAGIKRSANEIITKLRKQSDAKWGVFDIRQLRPGEVADALKVDKATAKKILNSYKKAVMKLSTEERGLAGKLTDLNLNYNPLAAPYSRVQNLAKYEKNPFFSIQERIETRLGTAALTGKTRMPGKDYSKQVQELEKAGFWENAGFGSEGADIGNITNITSKLKKGQKETLAAGIDQLAQKQGKSITEFISDPKNADLMQDFKSVVQYPDKGFTSSNLSKMMNLVAFPTRYNIKIAQFAVKQLAKQPGLVQQQVLRSIGDYNEFMNSPEGIKFQADNKEVMGLINYFTPMGNIQQVMNLVTGKARKPADFGLIGGLPFGVITQALQGQGLFKTDTAYVDPRTGEVYPDKIPDSLKARAHKLLSDIIGTMYNYPGRIVGAPLSKGDANAMIPNMILGEPGKDEYKSVKSDDISPEDRKRMQVLGALPKGPASLASKEQPVKLNQLEKVDVVKGLKFARPKKAKLKRGFTPSKPIRSLR